MHCIAVIVYTVIIKSYRINVVYNIMARVDRVIIILVVDGKVLVIGV